MSHLTEELSALRYIVKQMDERTLRGERLMLDMQGEQLRMSRAVDRIASALHVNHVEHGHHEPVPAQKHDEQHHG